MARKVTAAARKLAARDRALRLKYGMTLDEYNARLKDQGGRCAVCQRDHKDFNKSLAVDHNHKTGRIRGLLCFACNKFKVGRHNLLSAKAVYEYLLKFDV